MQNDLLYRSVFHANPRDNGGEALTIVTEFFDNGDPSQDGIYSNQKIELMSYGNCACFNLFGPGTAFDPDNIRNLANEIDKGFNIALEIREATEKPDINSPLHTIDYRLSPNTFGDESLFIKIMYSTNGDKGIKSILLNQEITLNSNINSATIHLCGSPLDPKTLRDLANELERAYVLAKRKKQELVAA